MTRFRPNLVIEGTHAGAEDRHGSIEIVGGPRLSLVKRCDRCVVTTVDQTTGRKQGKEPLRTLARLRRNPRTGGAWFGQNAVPALHGAEVGRSPGRHDLPLPLTVRPLVT